MDNEKNTELDPFDEDDFLEDEEDDAAEDAQEDTDADEENGEGDTDEDAEGAEEGGERGDDDGQPDFAAMAAADVAEIGKAYPALGIKSLTELNNLKRFGELRDMGMTAVEAFRATNADRLTANAEQVGANKATGKAHLQSVAKKAGARAASQMTKAERDTARELFGDLSDEELEGLFKKVTKK
jgi:hypothetical protein